MIFSAFHNRWALRFPAWPLQDLFNNKYMCSHICFNQHSQMFLLRQTFPLCCLLKCRKFWQVWFCCINCVCVCVKVAQSCPTPFEPLECSLPGSSAHGIPQARKNTRAASYSLLQRIFLTQGLNLGLPHCRSILYRLSHQGSPPKNNKMKINPLVCRQFNYFYKY